MYKIFVINLEKDIDRLKFMENQLNELGLPFERFPAIYGKTFVDKDFEYDDSIAQKINGKSLTLGEIGCALSHKRVYQKFLKDQKDNHSLKYCIVLEDDVLLPKNFKDILEREIVKNEKRITNNRKWEYVTFDYPKPGLYFIQHWITSLPYGLHQKLSSIDKIKFIFSTPIKFLIIFFLSIYEGVRNFAYTYILKHGSTVIFLRSIYFAGCYIVSISGIEKMLHIQEHVIYPADRVPDEAKKRGMIFRAYAPLCVFQQRDVLGSSILGLTGEEFKDKFK